MQTHLERTSLICADFVAFLAIFKVTDLLKLTHMLQPSQYSQRMVYFLMPTILRKGPYRFHFYSDEGQEPPHIHVACGDGEVKFWLKPIRMASSTRLTPLQIREIERLVFEFHKDLLEAYNEFHS